MSHIVIVGGHGKVALLVEPLLVARGHDVRAVIRSAEQAGDVEATGAHAVVADVEQMDTQALTDQIRGADAVVWAAGAGGGDAARTYAVDRDAAIRTMDAAEVSGVRRFVMVSYLGAGADHVPSTDPFFPYADAKAQADQYLRASGLDWTILAPGTLTLDAPTGTIQVDPPSGGSVPRADVAAVVDAALADAGTIRRTIGFVSGPTPIAQALV